ncbi:PQQ-dependent sugar dehydrogenase [Sandaracinobacteroides hominis]|uniref:PQQ-dependent sugar dehydrogenase n=1 Tax=Sandaracinobacteroides hominis TaxID=2780086 RepID=UPI0018F7CC2B|nr:PQQ-dependent sugar dehydrogenase [Sandaracinobacteroides hominis]
MRVIAAAVLGAVLVAIPAVAQVRPPVVAFDVPAEPGVAQEVWATGLVKPWGMAFLPDGRAIVTEKAGRMRIVSKDGRVGPPVAGMPKIPVIGQGGLLDVAVHPDFATNGLVYFTHATGTDAANATALSRGKLTGNMLTEVQELIRNPVSKGGGQHFGSRLLWLPDGSLLMSVGDGGNPPASVLGDLSRKQAQNGATWFGKVLRVTADGLPVKNNPGVLNPRLGWDRRVWSIGHRNIQGLARDGSTGVVWATEHGARGGDELNRIVAGGNHGWPIVTYSLEYSGKVITEERSRPGFRDPVSVWVPSIAPSGLAVYRGTVLPGLNGAILAGGLMSSDVRVLRMGADGAARPERRIEIGARVRDVVAGPDGLIYVLTDEDEGRIIRLKPAG